MTYDEFIKALAAQDGKWEERWKGRIRSESTCPITFLCERLMGKSWGIILVMKAAKDLGLPEYTASRIVAAADNLGEPQIRRDLLAATTEKTA